MDPASARDLDDALSIVAMPTESGVIYRVGVHIADVSHFVKEGSNLDKEALHRATSVYLVQKVTFYLQFFLMFVKICYVKDLLLILLGYSNVTSDFMRTIM